MEFVEEARAAAEGARAAYRGRVAQAERSFLEARETRVESERSLGDALGSALLIARSKSLRLYPDRIECKGEAIRLGEVLGIDAEMEGSILQKVSEDLNNWSKSIRTIDKRTAVVTVRTPEWECSVRTGPGRRPMPGVSWRRLETSSPIPEGTGSGGTRGSRGCRGSSRGRTPRGRRRPRPVRPRGRPGGHAGGRGRRAQLTALMAQASPDDLSLLAEADREGARRASVRKGALAVGLALLGALLAFALFAALSAAISASPGPPSWTASGAAWRRPSRGPRSRRPRPRRAQVAPFHLRRAAADGSFITSLLSFLRPGTVRPAIVWPWISSHGRLLFAMFPRCCASFSARTAGVPQTRHISWCVRCHPKGVHTTGQTMMV